MQDEETGTWWQQVSGKAILGPLKGIQLKLVAYDEVSFGLWKKEAPASRVLRPKQGIKYDSKWEDEINKLPTVIHTTDLPSRTLIIGIDLEGISKAYPFSILQKHSLLLDQIGSIPILILLDGDQESVRVFDRRVEQRSLEFYATLSTPFRLLDSETGSEWSFEGMAVSGPFQGQQLKKIRSLKDFWFDWKNYHPGTLRYNLED